MLKTLWDSTRNLYERFAVSDTPIFKRQRIFMEEVLEFLQESSLWVGQASIEDTWYFEQNKNGFQEDLLGEAADVIVTVCGVLLAHGISYEDLEAAVGKVAAKNDAKTDATHYKDAQGKISRRPKVPYEDYKAAFQKLWKTEQHPYDTKAQWNATPVAEQVLVMERLAGMVKL